MAFMNRKDQARVLEVVVIGVSDVDRAKAFYEKNRLTAAAPLPTRNCLRVQSTSMFFINSFLSFWMKNRATA
jgi:hypothetical protein